MANDDVERSATCTREEQRARVRYIVVLTLDHRPTHHGIHDFRTAYRAFEHPLQCMPAEHDLAAIHATLVLSLRLLLGIQPIRT